VTPSNSLNPQVAGVTSDDGFTMGQLTMQTLDLLVTTTLIGVIGGGIYYVLRGLLIGPRWFQILSVSVGPAVVSAAVSFTSREWTSPSIRCGWRSRCSSRSRWPTQHSSP
jgi:hypothetical protein